jgi:hypothetical protein
LCRPELQHHILAEVVQQLLHPAGVDPPDATGMTPGIDAHCWSK